LYARVVDEEAVRRGRARAIRIAGQLSVAAILGLLGLLASVLLVAHSGRAASTVSPETASEGSITVTAPAETLTETLPDQTIQRIVPAETVTVSQTETTMVTETSAIAIVRPGAAAAGAAAAASKEEADTSSTQWGWIAFGILAFAVLVGGVVWLIRRSKGTQSANA
jgi:cobalamin biosynthesis Mg chelatase CobN